jgi:hypothetical protein
MQEALSICDALGQGQEHLRIMFETSSYHHSIQKVDDSALATVIEA